MSKFISFVLLIVIANTVLCGYYSFVVGDSKEIISDSVQAEETEAPSEKESEEKEIEDTSLKNYFTDTDKSSVHEFISLENRNRLLNEIYFSKIYLKVQDQPPELI